MGARAGYRVALVLGARVAVVAKGDRTGLTPLSRVAPFQSVARVAVVAGQRLARQAPELRVATFLAVARVAVVANGGRSRQATEKRVAPLDSVAQVAVAAGQGLAEGAAHLGVAPFLAVARIAVVAVHAVAGNAEASRTLVIGSTYVAVLASRRIGCVGASGLGRAGVVRAQVAVVAGKRDAGSADTRLALVSHRAGVTVVARRALVLGSESALPRRRVTGGLLTDGAGAFRRRALNNGVRVHQALVGPGIGIAQESPVACIPVLQSVTILVRHTITGDREPLALLVFALVRHCAGIIVITVFGVGRERTAAQTVAGVVGAVVAVVAHRGRAYALSLFAMVSHCAGIAVFALPFGKGNVLTAFFAGTGILGALVTVIASRNVDSVLQRGLVHFAIAIIVQPVAGFGCGDRCIAFRQATLQAHSFAQARTRIVDHFARGPQPQRYRGVGAGAHAGVVDAFFEINTVHSNDVDARETPRALFTSLRGLVTGTATEVSTLPVVDAGILGPGRSGTVTAVGAGAAQVGVV